jgi:hypothetical protein
MAMTRGTLPYTFEYAGYGNDPGFVELEITFGYTPGQPESGRFGPPENYDPGSGHEVWFEYAEIEVERDGKKVWERLMPGEWLEGQCRAWLETRDEDDLVEGLPCREPDYDRAYDEARDRRMWERAP